MLIFFTAAADFSSFCEALARLNHECICRMYKKLNCTSVVIILLNRFVTVV